MANLSKSHLARLPHKPDVLNRTTHRRLTSLKRHQNASLLHPLARARRARDQKSVISRPFNSEHYYGEFEGEITVELTFYLLE